MTLGELDSLYHFLDGGALTQEEYEQRITENLALYAHDVGAHLQSQGEALCALQQETTEVAGRVVADLHTLTGELQDLNALAQEIKECDEQLQIKAKEVSMKAEGHLGGKP